MVEWDTIPDQQVSSSIQYGTSSLTILKTSSDLLECFTTFYSETLNRNDINIR